MAEQVEDRNNAEGRMKNHQKRTLGDYAMQQGLRYIIRDEANICLVSNHQFT